MADNLITMPNRGGAILPNGLWGAVANWNQTTLPGDLGGDNNNPDYGKYGTTYNVPLPPITFGSVPFNQSYGGQRAPYDDLSAQILDSMRVPTTYTQSWPWNNGAGRYAFGNPNLPAYSSTAGRMAPWSSSGGPPPQQPASRPPITSVPPSTQPGNPPTNPQNPLPTVDPNQAIPLPKPTDKFQLPSNLFMQPPPQRTISPGGPDVSQNPTGANFDLSQFRMPTKTITPPPSAQSAVPTKVGSVAPPQQNNGLAQFALNSGFPPELLAALLSQAYAIPGANDPSQRAGAVSGYQDLLSKPSMPWWMGGIGG